MAKIAEVDGVVRQVAHAAELFDPGDGPEGTYLLDFVGPDNAGLAGGGGSSARAVPMNNGDTAAVITRTIDRVQQDIRIP